MSEQIPEHVQEAGLNWLRKQDANVTAEGESQLEHVEQAQQEHDVQLAHGLGLSATQRASLNEQAIRFDWDAEQIGRAEAAIVATNSRNQ